MKTRYGLLAAVAVIGGGAALVWGLSGSDEAAGPPPQYAEVSQGDLSVEVSATGTVEPEYVVEIKSKASGTVQAIHVEAGSEVAQGDPLLEIDPVVELRKVAQAETELRMTQAQRGSVASKLEFAKAQLQRDEALHRKGLVARDALDLERKEVALLRGDLLVADAQLQRSTGAVEEAKERLAETRILSPIAGTVLERSVSPGTVVTAGTAQGGQTLMRLADLSRLFVKVQIDEADIAKIAAGQKARVTSDALPGVVFLGKVLRVAPMGRVESSVTVFDVVVELTGTGRQKLRPMLSANVFIQVGEVKDAVLVPRAALQQKGSIVVVNVKDKGPQRVKIGLADDQQAQILSGVEAGAQVLLPGSRRSSSAGGGAQRASSSALPSMGGSGGRRGGRL